IILISSEKIEEVMVDIRTKTTMEKFTTNDKANYYSEITSIMVNGKRAYELKGFANEEISDAKEANNDDEQEADEIFKIEINLFDYETPLTKTYEDYENELNDELEEPWFEDGVPYEICDHICEPFLYKNGKAKWTTCNSNEDGFCNG
nr:hypothetical protein [Tanacetum cinerariifolium]GEZ67205.1 hypothetical protein [Tanacetum cinerariifolium]